MSLLPNSRIHHIALSSMLAASCFSIAPAAASDAKVFTKYSITIAGIPIGNARVSTTFKGKRFNIVASGKTAGVSRLVSDGRGTLSATGVVGRSRAIPSSFEMDTVDDKFVTRVRMGMSGGSIRKLLATPPLAKRPDRVPVTRQHRRNVLDPLSAFLIPLDSDGRIEPAKACNRTIPVFDGWQRFNVRLSFGGTKNASLGGSDGYNGSVVVCKARYVPVAGHRPTRSTTVYLQNNKNMEVWFAPIQGLPVLVPVHIKIGTRVGNLSLSSSIFSVTGVKSVSTQ